MPTIIMPIIISCRARFGAGPCPIACRRVRVRILPARVGGRQQRQFTGSSAFTEKILGTDLLESITGEGGRRVKDVVQLGAPRQAAGRDHDGRGQHHA